MALAATLALLGFHLHTPPRTRSTVLASASAPTPDPALSPVEIVDICQRALQKNDFPEVDAGRELNFAFAGDQLRAIWGGSMDEFVRWSKANPVFEYMVDCDDFEILEDTVETNEGTPTRGSLTKMVVRVRNDNQPSKKGARDYLWTLQQERRPPMAGCWLLWQVIAVDKAHELTV